MESNLFLVYVPVCYPVIQFLVCYCFIVVFEFLNVFEFFCFLYHFTSTLHLGAARDPSCSVNSVIVG